MQIISDYKIALNIAYRARFLTIGFWLLLVLVTVVLIAAQFSGRQPATVALDIGISATRLLLPLLIVLLVQELFTREFDRRYILASMTYPRPRHHFFLGRLLAIFTCTMAGLVVMAVAIAILVTIIGQNYHQATPVSLGTHYIITLIFIAIDLSTIIAVSAFLSLIATTPSFILIGSFGFLIVARSYSTIIALLEQKHALVAKQQLYHDSLGFLGYILPDLGALDVRMTALYNSINFIPDNWPFIAISSLAYGLFFIGLALAILHKKQFN
ncbi:MAG: hypothetical protein OEZ16_09915 [Chromatiales bacterium]|nr:hypothetical protein [Chromatiales bacterium]